MYGNYVVTVKSTVEISQNFVAFSEYIWTLLFQSGGWFNCAQILSVRKKLPPTHIRTYSYVRKWKSTRAKSLIANHVLMSQLNKEWLHRANLMGMVSVYATSIISSQLNSTYLRLQQRTWYDWPSRCSRQGSWATLLSKVFFLITLLRNIYSFCTNVDL